MKAALSHKRSMRFTSYTVALTYMISLSSCHSYKLQSIINCPIKSRIQPTEVVVQEKSIDKNAQLAAAIRYEEGIGVPKDIIKAWKLYKLAAADSGGKIWVYVPSGGQASKGYVQIINRGPYVAGLPEARQRLRKIELKIDQNHLNEIAVCRQKN